MNTLKLTLLTALFCLIGSAPEAHADYVDGTYWLNGNSVKVKVKEKTKFTLKGWKHVKKVKVKVKVNGRTVSKTKVKIRVNGADHFPSAYENDFAIYHVGEVVNSVTIVNLDDADIYVDSIYCDTLENGYDYGYPTGHRRGVRGTPLRTAYQIAHVVKSLSAYVNLEEARTFLVPIRTQAGRCVATSSARGPYSGTGAECLEILIAQIDFAREFVQARLEIDASFNLTVELLSLREELADMLD